ncbi:MAG: Rrf2 family transcriptional regulator [Kiritimatiellae bacterium]|nr:Rrf2 family transcriptional regulator [Kiritimatiellia bacterium]
MAGIVSVSEAASIAFHTAFHLAANGNVLVRKQKLAEELSVSQEHLAKIIQRMARTGILQTVRGPKGGCRLTEGALSMTLLDIYEAIEGPYLQLECLLQKKICTGECCLLGGMLQEMSRELYKQLKSTTLKDVAEKLTLSQSHGEHRE